MNKYLSNKDLEQFLDDVGSYNIKSYEQIVRMKDPKELFNNFNYVIIFLPVKSLLTGHWQIVLNTQSKYYFFDSYGELPNEEMNKKLHIDKSLQKLLGDKLLIINNIQYQEYNSKIATCGRWVLLVLFLFEIYKKKSTLI